MSTKPIGTVVRCGSTTVVSVYGDGKLLFTRTGRLSAFDAGPCPHEFAEIGRLRTDFAVKFFEMLDEYGILNHFIARHSESHDSFIGHALRTMKLEGGKYIEVPTPAGSSVGRLIPLEWIVRREVATQGFIDRLADPDDPLTLERLQLPENTELKVGDKIPPFVECTTKLEPKDRYLSDEEALAISDLTKTQFTQAIQLMRHIAGLLLTQAAKNGLRIKDFKLELGLSDDERIMVADGLSPDEFRMVDANERSVDKDLFRNWLKERGFHQAVKNAQETGAPMPEYPVIPEHISQDISNGYAEAVRRFWQ